MLFTHRIRPLTPTHLDKKFHAARQASGATLNAHLPHHEQSKKAGSEDDFSVPVFVQEGMDQCHGKSLNDIDMGNLSSFNPTYNDQSTNFQNACDKNSKHSSSLGVSLIQEGRRQSQENLKICISSRDHSVKSSVNLSTRENINGLVKEVSSSPNLECREIPGSDFNRLNYSDASIALESRGGLPPNGSGCDDDFESSMGIQKEVVSQPGSLPNGLGNDSRYHADNTCRSLQMGSGDKSDDVSETSMVNSISGMDISPDDVVGVIGQKHFWKARRAIVNQQRVFAVQVFELHRLIKVQQLIAGSLDLLLEESAYLGRSSLKASPAKKFPSKYVVKPLPPIANSEDDSEKLNHKIECSAENAVEKTSLSSVKNGSQPSNYGPYLVNQPPPPVAADSGMGPWCLHQLPGQQWLIPIMSPSEGLVYKPFPGPGFMGTVCGGGCAPFGPIPNFMHPAYGIPSPLPPQGNGIMPGAHPAGHSYFPPYGIPVMDPSISDSAAEQNNQFAGPGSNNQFSQPEANLNMQYESTCNFTVQNNGAVLPVRQFRHLKIQSYMEILQVVQVTECKVMGWVMLLKVEMHFIFSPHHQLLRWQHLRLMTQTSQQK